jgi:hypothetical protein
MSIPVANILPPGWLDYFDRDSPRIGIGLDPATTTKKTSNPSGITVTQQVGLMYFARLILRFKTDDPDITEALLRLILDGLRSRGLSARRLCIAATNERFFAAAMRKKFAGKVPVELVIESEKTSYLGEEMLFKAYLGNLFVSTIDDGYLPLPPSEWVKNDVRLVVRERGTFDADLGEDGGHGDTFVSTGLSLHALKTKGGPAEAAAVRRGTFGLAGTNAAARKLNNPHAHRYGRQPGKLMN